MGFPGAHNVRRGRQGLGVARDVSAPRIGDLASRTDFRAMRQTAVATLAAAQNGTSGALAVRKHARR